MVVWRRHRRTDKKWVPVVRREVPALKRAELRKFVSPVFEELNWAFSSAAPAPPAHEPSSLCHTRSNLRFYCEE